MDKANFTLLFKVRKKLKKQVSPRYKEFPVEKKINFYSDLIVMYNNNTISVRKKYIEEFDEIIEKITSEIKNEFLLESEDTVFLKNIKYHPCYLNISGEINE